jgi:hypothetical protein
MRKKSPSKSHPRKLHNQPKQARKRRRRTVGVKRRRKKTRSLRLSLKSLRRSQTKQRK